MPVAVEVCQIFLYSEACHVLSQRSAKITIIKDRNGKDLTRSTRDYEEVARIHRTIQKSLSDQVTMMVWSPT